MPYDLAIPYITRAFTADVGGELVKSEMEKIREYFTSKDFSHYSVGSPSWLGKKTGDVIASPSTWSRVIRQLGLKRNRIRVYPAKPKVGIRASAPGQIWHLDLTILRLQDGTRAFVQCGAPVQDFLCLSLRIFVSN